MWQNRSLAIILLLIGVAVGFFVYSTEADQTSDFALQYGLDLEGGTHLVFEADTSKLEPGEVDQSMTSLRNVIERRVNTFGVSEPVVQVEQGGATGGGSQRLIVELPGVTDVDQAVEEIGETPVLDFRLLNSETNLSDVEIDAELNAPSRGTTTPSTEATSTEGQATTTVTSTLEDQFTPTGLTGRFLDNAQLQFNQTSRQPIVTLQFNDEGADLFADITRENTGRVLAIFLDGQPISTPVIQEEITAGEAQISGNFTPEEGRELVRDLRLGALPVPVELISSQTIGASLGHQVLNAGVKAAVVGLILVALFLILWYRLPGVVAVVSLAMYIVFMLAIFKLVPITITAAGIAGFILSIGMAVDANVLIFERLKEELEAGETLRESIHNGFSRAWLSIRDGNISSIITAVILFYAGTFLTQSFALTFGVGVLVSMITAIAVTRTFLLAISKEDTTHPFLFKSGVSGFKKSKEAHS